MSALSQRSVVLQPTPSNITPGVLHSAYDATRSDEGSARRTDVGVRRYQDLLELVEHDEVPCPLASYSLARACPAVVDKDGAILNLGPGLAPPL
eukprot:981141-Rhodomonas_salina.1